MLKQKYLKFLHLGIRPYKEGHPIVGVLVTDGKSSNSAKTQEFANTVSNNLSAHNKINSCMQYNCDM